MNFTILAALFSALVIAYFSLSVAPYLELGYTPMEKVEALDYLLALNALVVAQYGGSAESYLRAAPESYGIVSFTVRELVVSPRHKKIVVVFVHSNFNVTVTVELGLEVLGTEASVTPSGNVTTYIARVWSDSPVVLRGCSVVDWGRGYVVVETRGEVCDNRGLCVYP